MSKLVRGFRDIFEPQSNLFTELENCARGVLRRYGFSELRLPTVEQKEPRGHPGRGARVFGE